MRIAVIDGQGGGIGKHLTEKMRKELPETVEIIALGTNALATSLMLKAGANEGASGENAIMYNVGKVDVIVGTIAILTANSMLGELTPKMAQAVSESPAVKVLLSLNKAGIIIVGASTEPLPHQVNELIDQLKKLEVQKSVRS
ncbi:MAG: DUF3842 family protein [Clostridia bacterium]|nr:DUF3842 family protein [Clostridia bacterium]